MAMPPRPGDTLVVAGLWVRPMAESARRAGWRVIALDLFGDRDTREASRAWWRIGDPARFEIDPALLAQALERAARSPGVIGWVAGSGFEADPSLLDTCADALPRLGTAAADVAAVRDPLRWSGTLAALGLAHPPMALRPGPGTRGWLVKHAGGSGGWHIRPTDPDGAEPELLPGEYLQPRVAGRSMSVLFLADGRRARRISLNAQDVRPLGDLPFVYHGAIGPLAGESIGAEADRALAAMVPAFALRGLCSADFIATPQGLQWLEINPRPSATMVLADDLLPRGLMHAHVQASQGVLPAACRQAHGLRGHRIVHAAQAVEIDAGLSDALARRPRCHDLPVAGAHVAAGAPLCSVSARAADEAGVRAALEAACIAVLAEARVTAAARDRVPVPVDRAAAPQPTGVPCIP